MNWGNALPRIKNKDGTIKHIYRENSRQHVLLWDTNGVHCKEPDCEINKKTPEPPEEDGDLPF